MNFLAHLYLSPSNVEVKLGNFFGDFVKGSKLSSYSSNTQKGIRLHRAIDTYTDHHKEVKNSVKRLREHFRHYSPVIIDVFYDHFLAKNWSDYSTIPLRTYLDRFFLLIDQHKMLIPDKAEQLIYYMKKDDWLYQYQFFDGVHQSLTGISKRTKFDSKMEF
ncbi:MAG: ACP phosphodiesterase, partial [Bacteroidota bacterium]